MAEVSSSLSCTQPMVDHLSRKQRSDLMRRVRPKNSKIERTVFSHLRKRGIYFQRHYRRVPGTPDIAKSPEKKAVFIHSDFWHGWRFPAWSHKLPNAFWRIKISHNRLRDRRKTRQLRARGWRVLVVWEHSLKKDFSTTIDRIIKFLQA